MVVFSIASFNFQRFPEIWKNISVPKWFQGRDTDHLFHLQEGFQKDGFLVPISEEKLGPKWSLHFPMAEKEILWNMGCAKSIIKLLKQFRDCYHPADYGGNYWNVDIWRKLKSYALNTVVMTMIKVTY